MKPIAELFKLTPKATTPSQPTPMAPLGSNGMADVPRTSDMSDYQRGYGDCKGANGDSQIFRAGLEANYERFKAHCRQDEKQQYELKLPHVKRQGELQAELQKRNLLKELKEEKLNDLHHEEGKLDAAIAEVKSNPQKFGVDANKRPKVQFYIGLLLILPITLYLIVFYVSAAYSAFFKDFESTKVFAAIFDAQAFRKAMEEGIMEGIFICTIPFVFMGLGYLIHMFQTAKSKMWQVKLTVLFLITFIFDTILAYQIEKKIYDFNKTLDSPPFNFEIALTTADFWGIIFAGFLVYVIWGLVFDFIMKEYDNLDKIKGFIRQKHEEKGLLAAKVEKLKAELNEVKQEITETMGNLNKERQLIDGFIFPNRKYLEMHTAYTQGWFMAISKEIALPHQAQRDLIQACKDQSDYHKNHHDIANEGAESIAFTTKSAPVSAPPNPDPNNAPKP
jgi:hypothetical protein